jgi:predicted ATP-dependent endonuclease of OLD family
MAPILLIDEAETHLHLDAQADLVDFLLNDVQASQVLYTTHSPGCLPPDLGTGVRLVQPSPDRRGVSTLRGDFWNSKEVGFSPLLFAMGAGAAAFSTCRYAVLAEGPSDMILLPSLIRLAAAVPTLNYQVAPGLSGFHGQDLSIDQIATRVAYLVDGDTAGQRYVKELAKLGIPAARIFSLPSGMATEDLIDPTVYLAAVNQHLKATGAGVQVTGDDLDTDNDTVAHALAAWCKTVDVNPPGKVAIASRLIQNPRDLRLTPAGTQALRQLHDDLVGVFSPRRA